MNFGGSEVRVAARGGAQPWVGGVTLESMGGGFNKILICRKFNRKFKRFAQKVHNIWMVSFWSGGGVGPGSPPP